MRLKQLFHIATIVVLFAFSVSSARAETAFNFNYFAPAGETLLEGTLPPTISGVLTGDGSFLTGFNGSLSYSVGGNTTATGTATADTSYTRNPLNQTVLTNSQIVLRVATSDPNIFYQYAGSTIAKPSSTVWRFGITAARVTSTGELVTGANAQSSFAIYEVVSVPEIDGAVVPRALLIVGCMLWLVVRVRSSQLAA